MATLDVSDEVTVETLRGLIELDLRIKPEHQQLYVNNRLISTSDNSKSLKDVQLNDGDLVVVTCLGPRQSNLSPALTSQSSVDSPSILLDLLRHINFPSKSKARLYLCESFLRHTIICNLNLPIRFEYFVL